MKANLIKIMGSLKSSTPSYTKVSMNKIIQPIHVNTFDLLEGGQLLKWVDTCACLSAERLAAYPCVTVSVDDLYFEEKIKLGDILSFTAQVNRVFNTSMEVGVLVYSEPLTDGLRHLVCKAFITFVALNTKKEKVKLPPLVCETQSEKACYAIASDRRKVRISHAKTVQKLLDDYDINTQTSEEVSSSNNSLENQRFIREIDTRVESSELVLPSHANHHGNTFGGQVMAWMENSASISAGRYFQSAVVLKSVDMVYFKGPSTVGDRIVVFSLVNNVFKNSVEVGVRVEAYRYENGQIGACRHVNSAFFTYDCLVDHQFHVFIAETKEGVRRQKEATARRKLRLDRRYCLLPQTGFDDEERNRSSVGIEWNPSNSMILCCANITSLCVLSAQENWQLVSSIDKTELSTLENKGRLAFKATLDLSSLKLPAEQVFDVVKDPFLRPVWDQMVLGCRLLNDVSEDDSIFHMVVRSPDKEKPNDFVLLVSTRKPENKNDSYKVAMQSVTMRSFPEKSLYDRASVISSGFIITSSEKGICSEISYYNNTNAQIAPYITCDVAGLSQQYHHTFKTLENHLSDFIKNFRKETRLGISNPFH